MNRHILTHWHKLTRLVASAALALVVTLGMVTALPAGQAHAAASVGKVTPAPAQVHVADAWGFHALKWRYTVADPWGAYRIYYYNKCDPKPGVRYLTIKTNWIYRTYECWAILA